MKKKLFNNVEGNKSTCAHYSSNEIGIESGDDEIRIKSDSNDRIRIESDSDNAFNIRIFYSPPDFSLWRRLVLKIKQLVNYKCDKLNK